MFDRYAEVIHRPPDVTPRNILLDFDPADFIDSQGPPSVSLHLDDLCSDVAAGKFRLVANDDPHEVAIAWDETTRRYILSCNDLDDRFSIAATSSGPRAMSLLSYFNREQAFRVIPVGGREPRTASTRAGGSTSHDCHSGRRHHRTTRIFYAWSRR